MTDDIVLAGAEFQLSEKINRRETETAAYPFTGFLMTNELMNSLTSGFLADTGGALGLFLGLSLLQIFSWFGNVWSFLMRVWLTIQNHMIRKRKVSISRTLAL